MILGCLIATYKKAGLDSCFCVKNYFSFYSFIYFHIYLLFICGCTYSCEELRMKKKMFLSDTYSDLYEEHKMATQLRNFSNDFRVHL